MADIEGQAGSEEDRQASTGSEPTGTGKQQASSRQAGRQQAGSQEGADREPANREPVESQLGASKQLRTWHEACHLSICGGRIVAPPVYTAVGPDDQLPLRQVGQVLQTNRRSQQAPTNSSNNLPHAQRLTDPPSPLLA